MYRGAGVADTGRHRSPDRPAKDDRRILAGRPVFRAAARPLVPVRRVRLPAALLRLDDDVKLFFALGNAGIACWDCKIAYASVRPITVTHTLFRGQKVTAWAGSGLGAKKINGEEWQPYQPLTVVTPAFPEFCSGHSTFSAAAEVLKADTGSDHFGASVTLKASSSRVEPGRVPAQGVVLTWPTFAAASEAGLSCRYGGIHFESGDLCGRQIGRQVGALVWKKAVSDFQGAASPAPAPRESAR